MNITRTKLMLTAIIFSLLSMTASGATEKIGKCEADSCVNYFKQYKKAAKRGHSLAMLTLGQFYHHGYGTKVNEKLALKYFKKAARAGYTAAQFKAGYIYMSNKELRDIDESIEYLETAAKYEYKGADFLLGMIYLDDEYGVKNLAKADKHFTKSYKRKYKQMPKVVEYVEAQKLMNEKSFPSFYAEVNKKPLVKTKDGSLSYHDDNVEVITITSPPLETTFNKQIMDFRKAIKATGTRFHGKSCAQRLTCMQRADIADVTDFHLLFLQGFAGKDIYSGKL
ncbi:sel1 repeat family protein [Thalassotalea sp. M1531]|uniref:Sel1 repeat family protein n=1 Tax=Thalassotalea algicola TaxID=2716224 RepID=A0A7Y0LET0_9GAMM|nr:tetratricopeptide repeat protein [Thalassotalea algicola]NMP33204.1 sel1 repeat family protein [Thalassotalea algicola]